MESANAEMGERQAEAEGEQAEAEKPHPDIERGEAVPGGIEAKAELTSEGVALESERVRLLAQAAALSDGAASEPTCGCCDCTPRAEDHCRQWLCRLVNQDWFGNASTGLVLVNMALMCAPYDGMEAEYEEQLEAAATVISYIFIGEMALKLAAFGCVGYWADGWNCLDGSIVSMSIVEIVLTILFAGGGVKLSFLRILRMLRVLRMLRLMRSWKGLYKVVTTFGKALPQLSNIFIFMFLIALIFSLLGMQLLGGQFNPQTGFYNGLEACPGGVCPEQDGLSNLVEKPRYHYDYFMPAMLTTFIAMVRARSPCQHRCTAVGRARADAWAPAPSAVARARAGQHRPRPRLTCALARAHCSGSVACAHRPAFGSI